MEKAVQTSQRTDQELSSVQFLTITAAFVALTYIFTAFINVKLPIVSQRRTDPPWKCAVIHRCHFIRKENRSHCRWDRNGAL